MKKAILLCVVVLILCPAKSEAQNELPTWQSYFKMSYCQPVGKYHDFYNAGFGMEYGKMFPLFLADKENKISVGLDFTFLYTSLTPGKDHFYGIFPMGDQYGIWMVTQGGMIWDLGVKIGPMASMEITKDLFVDISFQYSPTVVIGFRKGPNEESVQMSSRETEYKSSASISFAHRFAFKAGLRYQRFMFNMEYMCGSTNLHYGSAIVPSWAIGNNPVYKPLKQKNMGLGTFSLGIGIAF